MAYLRFALYFANSGLENLSLDFVARHDLFRALVFNGLEFNKTQVFALFPPSAGSPLKPSFGLSGDETRGVRCSLFKHVLRKS